MSNIEMTPRWLDFTKLFRTIKNSKKQLVKATILKKTKSLRKTVTPVKLMTPVKLTLKMIQIKSFQTTTKQNPTLRF